MRPNKYFTKMKKIFLFIATATLAFSMNSCSSDDNSDSNNGGGNETTIGGTLSVKIDGVQKNFNNVIVNAAPYDMPGNPDLILLDVTASTAGNSSEYINFQIFKGRTGANSFFLDLQYTLNNVTYRDEVSSITQINSNNALKGTFNGEVEGYINNAWVIKTLTEGKFDVKY